MPRNLALALPAASALALAAASALGAGPASGASAADSAGRSPGETVCKIDVRIAFRPGIGLKPGAGSYETLRGGTTTCDGAVLGTKVTGPGTYSSAGRIGTDDPDSCASGGEGWGVFEMAFPAPEGKKTLRSPFTFTYGAVKGGGPLSGRAEADHGDATFDIVPLKGDCVTAPVTLSRVLATITLHEFETAG